ncbi:MAG: nucleotide disphospho-sugar-binding domain-containing protein [Chloroflexota bacterium]
MIPTRIAFFAYAYNLAETTRAIEIAKALLARGVEVRFFTHGGTHEGRITEAGFPLTKLSPLITPEKNAYLMDIDQGRRFGQFFDVTELSAYVSAEVEALHTFQPAAVYAGMNLPCILSARAAGVPLVYLLPMAGTRPYFQRGLAVFPEIFENWLTRRLPQSWKNKLINALALRLSFGVRSFNRVAKAYGLPRFRSTFGLLEGDLTLLTDLPELTGVAATHLPPGYRYVGPIFAHLPLPVPEEVRRVFGRPGLKVFCAMGSSTPAPVLRKVLNALRTCKHNVVIATTSILDPAELQPLPENVFATRYLPAPQVNEMADIAVTHGGQGTVQTALWAGTPIVGVALQFEQQSNLELIVRAGAGKRLPLKGLDEETLLAGIEAVAQAASYRRNAQRIQKLMRSSDGAQQAADEILRFLENSERS